eukprot:6493473-Pyramimonas_sp.AAC.1
MGCSKVRVESPSVFQDRAPKKSVMLLISLRQLEGGVLPWLQPPFEGGVVPELQPPELRPPEPPSDDRTAEKGEV